ncbi:hypothetical protein, partial [uncultured Kushneria sp.]|uniref:hypothetical protein n=1 Tax=uncultured Kushneria sp. TaxID=905033 RepID=UPI002612E2BE
MCAISYCFLKGSGLCKPVIRGICRLFQLSVLHVRFFSFSESFSLSDEVVTAMGHLSLHAVLVVHRACRLINDARGHRLSGLWSFSDEK